MNRNTSKWRELQQVIVEMDSVGQSKCSESRISTWQKLAPIFTKSYMGRSKPHYRSSSLRMPFEV